MNDHIQTQFSFRSFSSLIRRTCFSRLLFRPNPSLLFPALPDYPFSMYDTSLSVLL